MCSSALPVGCALELCSVVVVQRSTLNSSAPSRAVSVLRRTLLHQPSIHSAIHSASQPSSHLAIQPSIQPAIQPSIQPGRRTHGKVQSLISQLKQIRTNVIVFDPKCVGTQGRRWHFRVMPAVWSLALPGPIKLIFNVCPTYDWPGQGWSHTAEASAVPSSL